MMRPIKEIIKAGAIGDAFGYQVEFHSIEQICSIYGPNGIIYKKDEEKYVSDDTQMTLFLWEAVKKNIQEKNYFLLEDFIKDVHLSFKSWYKTSYSEYRVETNDK